MFLKYKPAERAELGPFRLVRPHSGGFSRFLFALLLNFAAYTSQPLLSSPNQFGEDLPHFGNGLNAVPQVREEFRFNHIAYFSDDVTTGAQLNLIEPFHPHLPKVVIESLA